MVIADFSVHKKQTCFTWQGQAGRSYGNATMSERTGIDAAGLEIRSLVIRAAETASWSRDKAGR